MTLWRVLSSVLLLPVCWLLVSVAQDVTTPPRGSGSTAAPRANSSGLNGTRGGERIHGLSVDSSMIQRALYVLIGITVIGVLYFLIRAVRLKKPVQRKKYGLLLNHHDSVEMEAVDSEEDDTLFESRSLHR